MSDSANMTAYVFIFVPICIGRDEAAKRSAIVVEQDRQQATGWPFWTWFIDNPRPQYSNSQ